MQLMLIFDKYHRILVAVLVLAVLLTALLMPSLIVAAGKAASTGG